MDRNRFNIEVRPHVTEIPIGSQGVAFDRLDLDDWADEYKSRNGRRLKVQLPEDDVCQSKTTCRVSAEKAESGTLKNAAGANLD